jgi:hypothetical protein
VSVRRRKTKLRSPRGLMSLENERWFGLRKSADAVLNQVLTQAYRRLGIAHEITAHGVRMSAYTREHIMHNSDGAKSVHAHLERRGIDPENATSTQKGNANLAERRHKAMFALSEMRDMWRARNLSRGFAVFEPGDRRLEAGFALVTAMTAPEAVGAGLELAAARGERVYDERKLLEVSIRASSYATPHADIRSEIEHQLQCRQLVMSRGALERPSDEYDLAATRAPKERTVLPMASYGEAVGYIEAAENLFGRPGLLSQDERDGVVSAIAGESRFTVLRSTAHLSQPASLAAVQAAARAAGVDVTRLSPASHPASESRSLESALEGRALLAHPGSLVLLVHAQSVSRRAWRDLRARVDGCDARLVAVYDMGHNPPWMSALQVPELAFSQAAEPFRYLQGVEVQQRQAGSSVRGHQDAVHATRSVVDAAVKRVVNGEPVLVLASTRAAADELNIAIVKELATATGQATTSIPTIQVQPVADAKSVSSYQAGDNLRIKRKTGTLRRREIVTVDGVNARAGALRLSGVVGTHTKVATLSLSTHSHHVERVQLSHTPVLPGTLLRIDVAMHTLGLAEGDIVRVEEIEGARMHLAGQDGSPYQVSLAGPPLPMRVAMASTPGDITLQSRTLARFEKPEVLVHLAADATSEQIGAALYEANSLSEAPHVHFDQALLAKSSERAPDAFIHASQSEIQRPDGPVGGASRAAARRLMVSETDTAAMTGLRKLLEHFEPAAQKPSAPVNVTLVLKSGKRELHKLRDFASACVLGERVNRAIGVGAQVKSPAPNVGMRTSKRAERDRG